MINQGTTKLVEVLLEEGRFAALTRVRRLERIVTEGLEAAMQRLDWSNR